MDRSEERRKWKNLPMSWSCPIRAATGSTLSQLKAVTSLGERPKTRLTAELEVSQRFDFYEELLPDDSWEPDANAHQFEVEAILDDEVPLSTSTSQSQRKLKVKWVGYDGSTWEPLSNLSCGGLLFDYLQRKKFEIRQQMVKAADED
ncbi:hypothetical protein PI124_g12465 [Phytophthora idaei]|nr:hypothetical protein PI125_g12015 [Phytophthora idaei]KAG3149504.1 hypothetical protein PI126_g11978 [Phytophthora idaei]KAG3242716.1 hypothetical protein PI124_g12465 [Phytophthora idaei]